MNKFETNKKTSFALTKYSSAVLNRPETEFQILGVGYRDFNVESEENDRRIQPYHTLHYVLSGKGYLEFRNRIYEISANDVFVLPDNEPFLYYADKSQPWAYAFFEFNGSLAAAYAAEAGFSHEEPIKKCPSENKIRAVLKELFEGMNEHDAFCYFEIFSAFSAILASVSKRQKAVHSIQEDQFITNVKNFINLRFLDPDFSIKTLTEEFHISHSYLCKIFKQRTGETIVSYINNCKMLKAKHLLKTTTLHASEIAYMSGFNCYPYFIDLFQKRHKMTTGEYRKWVKENQ